MSYDLTKHEERKEETSPDVMLMGEKMHPEADLTIELERHYRSSQLPWEYEAMKNTAFFYNMQFTEEQIRRLALRAQAAVPINVIYPATDQAVAMLTTQSPKFQGVPREDSDAKTAKVFSDLMSYIWDQSTGNVCLKNALFDYYIKGRGVLMAYVDPFADENRGEVKITDINPLEVYPDPNSRDRMWRDAAHIIVSRIFTREQIENTWPSAEKLLQSGVAQVSGIEMQVADTVATQNQSIGVTISDAHHEHYRVIERFTKVKVNYHRVSEPFPHKQHVFLDEEYANYRAQLAFMLIREEGQQIILQAEDVAEVQGIYDESQDVAGQPGLRIYQPPPQPDQNGMPQQQPPFLIMAYTKGQLIDLGILTSRKVMLNRVKQVIVIGGKMFYEGYLPIEDYPIVPIVNRQERNPYPMSDIGYVKPMQESLNKLHMLMVANAASSTNLKVFVPRGSADKETIERDLARAGTAVIEYAAEVGEVKIAAPTPLPSGLYQQFQLLISMIEKELGIFSVGQGDPASAPPTFKGTLALDEFGQRRIRSKLDDLEASLNQLGKVIVPLIQVVYREEKMLRIVQPNNVLKEVRLNMPLTDFSGTISTINDLSSGKYDVVVVSGSTLPSNRMAQAEYYMELYQLGIVDQVEVLKKTDVPDAEAVLERIGMIQQLQRQLQAMEEENKKLKGDLQTAEREELHAKKRLKLASFEQDLNIDAATARKATELYEARLGDQLQVQAKEAKLAQKNGEAPANPGPQPFF